MIDTKELKGDHLGLNIEFELIAKDIYLLMASIERENSTWGKKVRRGFKGPLRCCL